MSDIEEKRHPVKSLLVGVVGLLSAVYLINPGAGFIELIPDNLPFFGNLDEAAAATMLISCLAYFGLDIGKMFGGRAGKEETKEKPVGGKVVED